MTGTTPPPAPAPLLTPTEVAQRLSCSTKLLGQWRINSTGPAFTNVGRLARYSTAELERWLTRQPGGTAGAQPAPDDTPTPLRLLSPTDTARYLNTGVAHLAKMRSDGRGPTYLKIGNRLVRYDLSALNRWLDAQTRTQTHRADATGVTP